jgi:hypothetical protein
MIFEFWQEICKEEENLNNDSIIVKYYCCYYINNDSVIVKYYYCYYINNDSIIVKYYYCYYNHHHLLIELDSPILDVSLLTHSNASLFHRGVTSTSLVTCLLASLLVDYHEFFLPIFPLVLLIYPSCRCVQSIPVV